MQLDQKHVGKYLNEIHSCSARGLHQQHTDVGLRRLDAAVQHAQEDRGVVIVLHHQLLSLLHQLPEPCWPNGVGVVEEQITLTCQFHLGCNR